MVLGEVEDVQIRFLLGRYARSIKERVRTCILHFWTWRKRMIRVDRDAMWNVLRSYGIGGRLAKSEEFVCWQ